MTYVESLYLRDTRNAMHKLAKSERYSMRARDAMRAMVFTLDDMLHYETLDAPQPDCPRQFEIDMQ